MFVHASVYIVYTYIIGVATGDTGTGAPYSGWDRSSDLPKTWEFWGEVAGSKEYVNVYRK